MNLYISVVTLIIAGLLYGCDNRLKHTVSVQSQKSVQETIVSTNVPESLQDLLSVPGKLLGTLDIALVNVLCAQDLPGFDDLDVDQCLATLDRWAKYVKSAEDRYMPEYKKNPKRYDESLAKFKAINLALTLKEDLKCSYNLKLVDSGFMADLNTTRFFKNSKDLFIHGFTANRKGSCSSLPVLMVAVGRRCGYPLYLVTSKGHLFCRWDDGSEKFNIETAIQGVDIKPDSYYRNWPYPITSEEEKREGYLKSLSPAEELSIFMQIRAACLQENGRYEDASTAYKHALEAFPNSNLIRKYDQSVSVK